LDIWKPSQEKNPTLELPTVGILGIPNIDYQARPSLKVPLLKPNISKGLEKFQESILNNHHVARDFRAEPAVIACLVIG
jgi:hypothetical protein